MFGGYGVVCDNYHMQLRETAYTESIELLRRLSCDRGFMGSTREVSNYRRIWARDGVVDGLASLVSGEDDLVVTFRATLETLKNHQDDTGRIPSNVSLDELHVSYGTTVGRIDATLWYVIGVCQYALRTHDLGFFELYRESVEKALFYLRCLELNGRGLIYIPHGGDWADEYLNHGYVLFDQVLYYFALSSYTKLADNSFLSKRRDDLRSIIAVNFFPESSRSDDPYVYHSTVFDLATRQYERPLPLTYFTNYDASTNIDLFANSLLLLSPDLLSDKFARELSDKLCEVWQNLGTTLMPAFYPVITEDDEKWSQLAGNHLFEFRNKPYEYQNGGLWPITHGFFVASLSNYVDMEEKLNLFAERLARDEFVFPEYYHGKTQEAQGTHELGWSASGYILAHASISGKKKVFV